MATQSQTKPQVVANGVSHDLLQPLPRKPFNSRLRQVASSNQHPVTAIPDRTPGGTPTPPDDAPPSVKATSAVRRELRRKTQHRIFPTIEYEDRVSYFDPRSTHADFRGFFVLFWIGLGILVVTTMARNLKETGTLLDIRQWPLFVENIYELAVWDGIMSLSTAIDLPLQLLYKSQSDGLLAWRKLGMVLQCALQAVWLTVFLSLPFVHNWTWTAQVFFTLHILAIFMKMHSYAFYCGHLSTTFWRLQQLDDPSTSSTSTGAAVRYPWASSHLPETSTPGSRKSSPDGENEAKEITPINQLRADLARELTSPLGIVTYPQNLTLANFWDYLLCPTVCYELEYPRTAKRNYLELFYKILAVFGCIFLLTFVTEQYVMPVLDESALQLQTTPSASEKSLILAETVSRLLFPFMAIFLLVFLVIFEYILNAFAEITLFADRRFYSDWWNGGDWLEFSRDWNIPVHNFARRHIYGASRGASMSRPVATLLTFLISSAAHEVIMGCITRKFRGYGFGLMMLQMPLVMLQRMPGIRDRKLLKNVLFWISIILGLSLVSLTDVPSDVLAHSLIGCFPQLCALYVLV